MNQRYGPPFKFAKFVSRKLPGLRPLCAVRVDCARLSQSLGRKSVPRVRSMDPPMPHRVPTGMRGPPSHKLAGRRPLCAVRVD